MVPRCALAARTVVAVVAVGYLAEIECGLQRASVAALPRIAGPLGMTIDVLVSLGWHVSSYERHRDVADL